MPNWVNWRISKISSKKKTRLNHEIKVEKVRLIGEDGEQAGIVAISEALARANEAGLDLVEISPGAEPPVCRIMDYGKFQFQHDKRKAKSKKKLRQTHVKEIKFRPTIEEGDYKVKLRKLVEFLEAGDKVKISLRFRGREITHQDLGQRIMLRLQQDLNEHGVLEQDVKLEGRQLVMVFSSRK